MKFYVRTWCQAGHTLKLTKLLRILFEVKGPSPVTKAMEHCPRPKAVRLCLLSLLRSVQPSMMLSVMVFPALKTACTMEISLVLILACTTKVGSEIHA